MLTRADVDAEHERHRERVREFCEATVAPAVEAHEAEGRFPRELVAEIGAAGLTGVPYPSDVGGGDGDFRGFAITVEELARSWKLVAGAVNIACGLVGYPIATFGADWQRESWLASICRGEWLPAFALTEPTAGSDAGAIETTARRDGDDWVIDGHKIWTTHGSLADLIVVAARTETADAEGDISLFGVPHPRDRDGFEVLRDIPCMEGAAAIETELRLEGVRVPADHVIGEVGRGFRYMMEGLDIGRLGTAAQGVGIAQGAFEASRAFAGEREQFDRPIHEFQGVGFKLADMASATAAARLLTLAAAHRRDREERITQAAAMAKTFATDVAMDVATEAVQVHGARGYSHDYPVERYMREAKGTQIYDGTNEINRLVVVNRMYD